MTSCGVDADCDEHPANTIESAAISANTIAKIRLLFKTKPPLSFGSLIPYKDFR